MGWYVFKNFVREAKAAPRHVPPFRSIGYPDDHSSWGLIEPYSDYGRHQEGNDYRL